MTEEYNVKFSFPNNGSKAQWMQCLRPKPCRISCFKSWSGFTSSAVFGSGLFYVWHQGTRFPHQIQRLKCHLCLSFIPFLLSYHPPFHLRPPTQPDDLDFSEQILRNVRSTYRFCRLHFYYFLSIYLMLLSDNRPNISLSTEKAQQRESRKKNPTSPPSFLNKTKIASFNNSKRAKGRGDEPKARVWMVALRCEQLQCCREQAGRCVHRYSWWPLSKHAELDLSLFCRITVPKLQV